jgi:hypothetical protein
MEADAAVIRYSLPEYGRYEVQISAGLPKILHRIKLVFYAIGSQPLFARGPLLSFIHICGPTPHIV